VLKKITVDISSPVHWQWNGEFSALFFFCKQSMSYSTSCMHIVDCIDPKYCVSRKRESVSPHFKHSHLNPPLKATPRLPQGCSHDLAVISANICRYSSALSAQQREVVSRSRSDEMAQKRQQPYNTLKLAVGY